jgi:hypothetical protein
MNSYSTKIVKLSKPAKEAAARRGLTWNSEVRCDDEYFDDGDSRDYIDPDEVIPPDHADDCMEHG